MLGQLKAYIGSRWHSTVGSLGSGTPTLSIVFSEKGPGLHQLIFGHRKYMLDCDHLNLPNLLEKLDLLLNEEKTARKQLSSAIPEIKKLAYSAGQHLKNALDD